MLFVTKFPPWQLLKTPQINKNSKEMIIPLIENLLL